MEGKCEHCGFEGKLTRDHIIPKWLYSQFPVFGLKKNLGNKNIQYICGPCNSYKGAMPDFAHPIAAPLADKLIEIINKQRKAKNVKKE